MENNTIKKYDKIIDMCRDIFLIKSEDYGASWRIMRMESITDQIFIKAKRIRTLESKKEARVNDGVLEEYTGIINYCIIALIQADIDTTGTYYISAHTEELSKEDLRKYFDGKANETKELMIAKNHDYGEAWKGMRISSLTDLILVKILRIKQIEDNKGITSPLSEDVNSGYRDIINYCIFAIIRLDDNGK